MAKDTRLDHEKEWLPRCELVKLHPKEEMIFQNR